MAKKTNYIIYELKKLDDYVRQLQDFLDKNPPNLAVDRTEVIATRGGGTSIKVIASIEDQVKLFIHALEKLPKALEDLNRLRKEVDSDKKELELRGGADRPGFMDEEDSSDEEPDEEEKPKPKRKASSKSSKNSFKDSQPNAFDDDSFFEDEKDQKLLPPSKEKTDEDETEDSDWLNERD